MAGVLRALAVGLPAFVLVKVLLPAFLAREDLRGPILAAVLGIAANVVVALALQPRLGSQAAALGVSASAAMNAAVLFLLLLGNGGFSLDATARRRLPRVLFVAALSGLAMLALDAALRGFMEPDQPLAIRAATLAAIVGGSILLHLALAHVLKAADVLGLRQAMRSRPEQQPD